MPQAVHQFGIGKRPTVIPRPCTPPGFTEPAPLDAAGALLPHLCTLTDRRNPQTTTIGGIFLWHYPHAHAHWALPSKLGLSGARTFLRVDDRRVSTPREHAQRQCAIRNCLTYFLSIR